MVFRGGDAGSVLARLFEEMKRRMLGCELEHFDLDYSKEFGVGSAAGRANLAIADCLLGVLEVLMEDIAQRAVAVQGDPGDVKAADEMSKVFSLHNRLFCLATERSSGKGGKPPLSGVTPSNAPAHKVTGAQLSNEQHIIITKKHAYGFCNV
jgi:hypothetical protein